MLSPYPLSLPLCLRSLRVCPPPRPPSPAGYETRVCARVRVRVRVGACGVGVREGVFFVVRVTGRFCVFAFLRFSSLRFSSSGRVRVVVTAV